MLSGFVVRCVVMYASYNEDVPFTSRIEVMLTILTARALRAQFSVRRAVGCLACCLALAAPAGAQERFSLFVPTDQEDVVRMLKLVGLRDGDVVFDLGSGDGRIVFEAARLAPIPRSSSSAFRRWKAWSGWETAAAFSTR